MNGTKKALIVAPKTLKLLVRYKSFRVVEMIFLCHLLLQGLVHLSWFVYCDSRKGRRNRHGGSIKISAVTVTKKCEQRRHCYTLRDLTFWVSLCVIVYHSRGYSTGLPSSIIDASELVVPHWQAVYDRFTNTHGRVASSEMSNDDLGTTIKKRIPNTGP